MKDRSTSGVTNQKSGPSAHVRQLSKSNRNGYPSPPASVSPRQDQFSHRREAFPPAYDGANSQRRSLDQASSDMITSTNGRRRVSSLTSRFPGDQSHRPLDIIKRDAKLANRAPHLRKNHTVGPDTIDSLDNVVGAYHHEGPFDATLLARNTSLLNSPVEAVSGTNEEALKATPREKIIDSLERHRPLDGVAVVPPGMTDQAGRTYNYREGANMMIEDGGNYKRWPGVVSPHLRYPIYRYFANFTRRNTYRRTSKERASHRILWRKPCTTTRDTVVSCLTAILQLK